TSIDYPLIRGSCRGSAHQHRRYSQYASTLPEIQGTSVPFRELHDELWAHGDSANSGNISLRTNFVLRDHEVCRRTLCASHGKTVGSGITASCHILSDVQRLRSAAGSG